MSWKINREVEKAREEEALMREFEFMKKYGVDISNVPFGMTAMLEAACHAAYNRGWADCKAKVDVPDTNVGEWIPCSERLPEEGAVVLVSLEKDEDYEWVRLVREGYYDEGYWHNTDGAHYGVEVIAWMPLPEAYKVGDQE